MQEIVSLTFGVRVATSYRTAPFLVRGGKDATGGAQALVYLGQRLAGLFRHDGDTSAGGRVFRDDDESKKNPVAIVDQVAERYLAGRDVVGQELALGTAPPGRGPALIRIIGVGRPPISPDSRAGMYGRFSTCRSTSNRVSASISRSSPRLESDIVNEMRARVRAIDPTLPLGTGIARPVSTTCSATGGILF